MTGEPKKRAGAPRHGDPCSLEARGWRSPLVRGERRLAYEPCPLCGCIHRAAVINVERYELFESVARRYEPGLSAKIQMLVDELEEKQRGGPR